VKEISATEASRNFSKLMDAVQKGSTFNITRGGQTIATVAPAHQRTGAQLIAIYDHREPDPELADAIEEGRGYVVDQEPRFADGA
jgi:antitoxin (DNA-binding transcriptional repressor) of toxin-antitoxin stability system